MGQFTQEHLKKIVVGLELFNQEKYWECHEALEDPWLEDPGDKARYVYWSLIQASTALYHDRNGNEEGAINMWKKACDKLDKCEEFQVESEFIKKLNWDEYKFKLRQGYQFLKNFKFKWSV